MNKRKLWTSLLAACLSASMLLAGCGGGGDTSSQVSQQDSAGLTSSDQTGTAPGYEDDTSSLPANSLPEEGSSSDTTGTKPPSGGNTTKPVSSQKPNNNPSTTKPPASSQTVTKVENDVTLSSDKIRKIGRVLPKSDGSAYVDWSASGIEFTINGTGAIVTMQGSSADKDRLPYVSIFVDGKLRKTISITNEKKRYNVCSGLPKGKHTIRVVKISEAVWSNIVMSRVEVQGSLEAAPKAKTRKLEFIGDSITSGWGMLVGGNDPFTTKTEDATRTWAAQTADALNAEYNMFSISGEGIAVSGQSIPPKYEKANPCTTPMTKWEFDRYQPDAVIINLGTNDQAQAVAPDKFKKEAVSFLKQLRSKNPNAQLVWAYGIMNNGYTTHIKAAIDQYKAETGDKKVHFYEFAVQTGAVGGQGHPSLETHGKMADQFTPVLKQILGW